MSFPSETDGLAFADLAAVVTHVGLSTQAFSAVTDRTGDPANVIANFALLDAPVIRAAVSAATIPPASGSGSAVSLNPMQAAQAGLVWRICRRVAFTRAGGSWASWPDVNPLDPNTGMAGTALAPPGSLSTVATTPTTPAAGAGPGPASRVVKVAAVLDQGDSSEVVLASNSDMDTWHASYISVMGEAPPEHSEPTLEQLSVLNNRLTKLKLSPYADFAVWVPYGRRGLRSMKFRTFLPLGDGSYSSREVPGPENFIQWEASWEMFTVAMIMLGAGTVAALSTYKVAIRTLVTTWPDCWHLIALADDKMRAEHWERIRRVIAAEILAGNPTPAGYTAAQPWSAVIRRSAKDERFWDEQVRHPAAAWVARGARGVQLAPEERIAQTHLPGGQASLEPEVEAPGTGSLTGGPGSGRKKRKTGGGKGGVIPGSGQLAIMDAPTTANKDGNKGKPGGKPRRDSPSGGGKKGESKDTPYTGDTCLNWDLKRGMGPCASMAPGTVCPVGRKHVCRTCGKPHRTAEHA